ncbi:hypothetical protein [Thalassotalea crassostreae]|uniref:hypothetical protein n=1 Tax=Thalassotalea crassostreae TaxID=1763536 RepID=UPI000838D72C|nr:hypothetical protein [Thalassotalea crassostreae]
MDLWKEIKRRNVVKVSIAYLALAWLVIQVTSVAVPALNLPSNLNSVVFFIGLIGFPFAIFFAWAFELTPQGIMKTEQVKQGESVSIDTGRKLDFAIIALLLSALIFVLWDSYILEDSNSETITDTIPSIAVIPLINMSSNTDNEFFAAGIHEEILTKLSYIKNLRVSSRTSTLKYIDSELSIKQIGEELNVRYIVEGSVRRMGNHVRVTAQLIDAQTDTHIWASNFDRELRDVFAIQSAIAGEISNSIHLKIQPSTVGKLKGMPTQSVKAYDYYVKAQSIEASERESEESLLRTRELLKKAVQEDPDFVDAWGLLNEICDHMIRSNLMFNWYSNDPKLVEQLAVDAKVALEKAVSLDQNNLQTLLALASDYVAEQASSEFSKERRQYIDKAINLYPEEGMPWYVLGWWFELNGDLKSADDAFRKGVEKDPFNARILQGTHIFYLSNFITSNADNVFSDMLYKRLENSVGGVSFGDSLGILWRKFLASADESIFIEYYDKQSPETILDFPYHLSAFTSILETPIYVFKDYENEIDVNNINSTLKRFLFIDVNFIILNHYHKNKLSSGSEKYIENLLLIEKLNWPKGYRPFEMSVKVTALVAKGDVESAKLLAHKIVDMRSDDFDPYGYHGIYAMSSVDIDYAVELLFNEKSKYESWLGMDYLAIDTISNWRLLSHPKVVDYYKQNKKWYPYLSKRLEAYH